jgi:uncharacterized protein (DUF433 family)
MSFDDLVTIDPDILGGTPVFRGTRVPVKSLFEYLEDNYTLEQFVEFFPTVTLDMARRVLDPSSTCSLPATKASVTSRTWPGEFRPLKIP